MDYKVHDVTIAQLTYNILVLEDSALESKLTMVVENKQTNKQYKQTNKTKRRKQLKIDLFIWPVALTS